MTAAHIHLGPHKTGSTAFQLYLQRKEDFFKKNHISFVSQHSCLRPEYFQWRATFSKAVNRICAGESSDQESFDELLRCFHALISLVGQNAGLIFSDENIIGRPLGHFYGRYEVSRRVEAYYPAFKVIIAAFRSALSQGCDQVFFYLVKRDWPSLVKSLYKDFFRKYYHLGCASEDDFLTFLGDCGARQTYDSFWGEVSELSGVMVVPYSLSSAQLLLESIDANLRLSFAPLSGEMPRKCNISLDDEIINKMIDLYPFLARNRERYSDEEFYRLVKLLS